jgi:class 3 adenylate cyclase
MLCPSVSMRIAQAENSAATAAQPSSSAVPRAARGPRRRAVLRRMREVARRTFNTRRPARPMQLHPEASRREDPHLPQRSRRGAQAGDGALRRRARLHGAAEQVDPEKWHGILDRFFQILSDGVHRFEGTVNQYTGDGIMALFGAPIAHEDHARRATRPSTRRRSPSVSLVLFGGFLLLLLLLQLTNLPALLVHLTL